MLVHGRVPRVEVRLKVGREAAARHLVRVGVGVGVGVRVGVGVGVRVGVRVWVGVRVRGGRTRPRPA
eukprot:scaffold35757_cov52-Phaeocystis_antarctica.AAC.7